jgi:diguanylate cyclase (GGDEF)-like protein/PAS domain S-box-containing protein
MNDVSRFASRMSPILIFLILICSIVVSEVLIALFIGIFPPFPRWGVLLLNAILPSVLIVPIIYFFIFRPLNAHITERNRIEEALRESEGRFRDLVEKAAVGVAEIDMNTGRFFTVNRRLCEMMGRTEEEILGTTFRAITHPEDSRLHEEKTQMLLAGKVGYYSLEKRYLRKDAGIVWVNLTVSPLWKPGEAPGHNMIVVEDITERKRMEAEIIALSVTDQLTGLYNRRGFMTIAEQQLRVAERTKKGILILYADIDGLKQINDKLGHKSGDEAIAETANVLKEVFRKVDIIARMGGDEFAVLAPEASLEHEDIIRNRLQDKLDTHNARAGRDYILSLSIGVLYHPPPPPNSLDELISRSDSLMYEQKRLKKTFGV